MPAQGALAAEAIKFRDRHVIGAVKPASGCRDGLGFVGSQPRRQANISISLSGSRAALFGDRRKIQRRHEFLIGCFAQGCANTKISNSIYRDVLVA
jgi:hypothetical protein